MPRWGAAKRGDGGFTLIELLVTVLLIGLITSFAVLTVPSASPAERQREEARRLLARMAFVRQMAILRAQSLGLYIDEDSYRFLAFVEGEWRPLRDRRGLAPHRLPDGMFFDVSLEGQQIEFAGGIGGGRRRAPGTRSAGPKKSGDEDDGMDEDEGRADGKNEGPRPRIFFLPGGEVMPRFTIRLVADETMTEYRIHRGKREWLALSRDEL